uniref:Uncharacterized protein n=1 Tax=Arundo donax TaxID=35708 RepID=A0A0A9HNH4_ARUDO
MIDIAFEDMDMQRPPLFFSIQNSLVAPSKAVGRHRSAYISFLMAAEEQHLPLPSDGSSQLQSSSAAAASAARYR